MTTHTHLDFTISDLKGVMGSFPTGVAIVTAIDAGTPVGFTCQSFVSLSLDPPLIALAPSKISTSWPRIRAAGSFCVNILDEGGGELCERFARSGVDKFVGLEWTANFTGAPLFACAVAWVECSVEFIHEAGDHELVVGRVLALGARDAMPLVFYRSVLRRIHA